MIILRKMISQLKPMALLVRSYVRKGRGQLASLLLIIITATAVMNLGALTLIDFATFLDDKADALGTPDVTMIVRKDGYSPAYEDFLRSDLFVTDTATEDILLLPEVSFLYGSGKLTYSLLIQNADLERAMAPMSITGRHDVEVADPIYAPFILSSGGGYKVGDRIVLDYNHQEYSFGIAGFVEDILYGSINMGIIGFFLPEAQFARLKAESPAIPAVLLSCNLSDQRYTGEVFEGLAAAYYNDGNLFDVMPADIAKSARSLSADISAMVMAAFAVVVTVVALIVIRFRIRDSIRDDVKEIGAMKAFGYTSAQIAASIMLQFLGVTLIGGLIGTGVAYVFLPLMSAVFSAQAGLIWEQGVSVSTSVGCLLILLAAVALDVVTASRPIKALEPVVAFQGSRSEKEIKKNHFRLDRFSWNLQLIMGSKHIMQNIGQSLAILVIIAAVTYASAFGLMFYYNMAVDSDSFISTIAGTLCSVGVSPQSSVNAVKLRDEIADMPGVRKAYTYDDVIVLIDDIIHFASVTEDFDELEGQLLYEGKYPKSADEVALSGLACEKMGKAIGDGISISIGGKTEEYIISGLIQSGNNMGRILLLDADGLKRIEPDFTPSFIYIVLEEEVDTNLFIRLLENRYGSAIAKPMNVEELIKSQSGSFVSLTMLLAVAILVVTGLVVSLILYFIIKTMIARRRRYFGIQKALGFTTNQIIQQIALSLLPVTAAGAVIGIVAGYFGVNPMLSVMFKFAGIMRVEMVMSPLWLALLCIGVVLFSYMIAILVSGRIKRISPYALMTD